MQRRDCSDNAAQAMNAYGKPTSTLPAAHDIAYLRHDKGPTSYHLETLKSK